MSSATNGTIVSLQLNVGRRQPAEVVESAVFAAGEGIQGDRHATGLKRRDYQVLLIDRETLETLGLAPGVVKENVTTSEIDLGSLTEGQRLKLGVEAVVEISKPCAPCSRMDEVRQGLQQELEGRRGMLGFVVQGGTVQVGDQIQVV